MGKSRLIYMLQCIAPGETRVIRNEYDDKIINALCRTRSMLVPITPRIGAFVDPRKDSPVNGMLTTPLQSQPRRLIVRGRFVVLAFDKGLAVDMEPTDILKFQKFYSPYREVKVIPPPPPNTVDSLPWDKEATNEL